MKKLINKIKNAKQGGKIEIVLLIITVLYCIALMYLPAIILK